VSAPFALPRLLRSRAIVTFWRSGADPASLSVGIDALTTDVAGLASDFGALQTRMNEFAPALDGLYGDAVTLEAMVEALEGLGIGGG
jgi:hypothetical protein